MLTLDQYIDQLELDPIRAGLSEHLRGAKGEWSVLVGNNPFESLQNLIDEYTWLGHRDTKALYNLQGNLARNLPGAMLQDYLIQVVTQCAVPYPSLDVFTEVKVPFGKYPIWKAGEVQDRLPSQLVDLAVGYLTVDGVPVPSDLPAPRAPRNSLLRGQSVLPLVVVNSKVRVSQSEFFDFLGREELLTKGNPNCMSVEVALRSEMDLSIVSASQASDKFFLLGTGGELTVRAQPQELDRFAQELSKHLARFMTNPTPAEIIVEDEPNIDGAVDGELNSGG